MHLQFWRSGNSEQATDKDAGVVPAEWLEADIKQGLSNSDVESRRKRFGWNEITTEKENLFIKFLSFFTGPVLYGKSSQLHMHLERLSVHCCSCNGGLHALLLLFASSSFGCSKELGRNLQPPSRRMREPPLIRCTTQR